MSETVTDVFKIPTMTERIIENDWKNIPSHKATGLDSVSVHILKETLPAALHKKDSTTDFQSFLNL